MQVTSLCFRHLILPTDLWLCSICILFSTTFVWISFYVALIKFYNIIHRGPMLIFYFYIIINRTNTFHPSYSFLWNSIRCSPDPLCPPSFASTWLKAVTPSVLAGGWHVSLVFPSQISVSIQITDSFLTL